ncbi:MAG: hypothetical protein K2X87_04835 [Gemmataceae bacterium]|nr:hypothetical protein [Gemmataceae bacterium]
MARGSDWTEARRERLADGMNPASGQFLLVKRPLVDRVGAAAASKPCRVA